VQLILTLVAFAVFMGVLVLHAYYSSRVKAATEQLESIQAAPSPP
jgi:hypothetical protein